VFIHSFIYSFDSDAPTNFESHKPSDGTSFENKNKRPGSWSSSTRESYSIPTKESNGNKNDDNNKKESIRNKEQGGTMEIQEQIFSRCSK